MTPPDFKAMAREFLYDPKGGTDTEDLSALLRDAYNRGLEDAARECEAYAAQRAAWEGDDEHLLALAGRNCARRIRALKGET